MRWVAIANLGALALLSILFIRDEHGVPREVIPGGPPAYPDAIVLVVVCAGIAMTALGIAATRASSWMRLVLSTGVFLTSYAALWRLLPAIPARDAWVIAGLLATTLGLIEIRKTGRLWLPLQIAALSTPYVIVVTGIFLYAAADVVFLSKLLSIAPLAGIAAGVLAFASVAEVLQNPHPRMSRWMGRPQRKLFIFLVLLLKLSVLLALYKGIGSTFVGGAELWNSRLDRPMTWVHALVVAATTLAIVAASERSPLSLQGRETAIAWILAASILPMTAPLVVGITGSFNAGNWVTDNSGLLQLIVVLAFTTLAVAMTFRQRSLTAGNALFLLAGLWLIPPLIGILAYERGTRLAAFWATPIQVDVALTCLVGIAMFALRQRYIAPRTQLRLLLLPALLIYAGVFLQGVNDRLERYLLVLAILWLLVAHAPRVAADPRRQTRVLGILLGVQVCTLIVFYLAFLFPHLASKSTRIGWLWLAVPLSAILTARTSAFTTLRTAAPDVSASAVSGSP